MRCCGFSIRLGTIVSATVFLVFALRFLHRELLARSQTERTPTRSGCCDARIEAHYADMCLLMPLVAPIVWEHHFVLVLPFLAWALISTGGLRRLYVAGLVWVVLTVPLILRFPFVYEGMIALLLLIPLTWPHGSEKARETVRFRF